MPPKKKRNKLDNMTEEERKVFLEQQMLAEEEERKRKEEMLGQFLKDKLAKEEKNTKFNLTKLQNQWRAIMRQGKLTQVSKTIQILQIVLIYQSSEILWLAKFSIKSFSR
jgi:hypothetical protein